MKSKNVTLLSLRGTKQSIIEPRQLDRSKLKKSRHSRKCQGT